MKKKQKNCLSSFFFTAVSVLFFYVLSSIAMNNLVWALGHARPGEIEQLKAEGKFEDSLKRALEIGNQKVDPLLVESFKIKMQRKFFESQGKTLSEVDELLRAASVPSGRQGGLPSIGSPRMFVLLIEFQDHTQVNSATDLDDTLFGTGDAANFPRESLTSIYKRASHDLLDLGNGTTLGWYQTAYDRSAVSETQAGRENLIKEALNYYDGLGHDFSQYDNNADGKIDYFIVYWAGPSGAWATFWWQANYNWSDSAYTLDGKTLRNYTWQPETMNPTIAVHETGHSLGLPDLYDYDNTVGPGAGVGGFDPMDGYTSDFTCFWKWMLDWLSPTVVPGNRQVLTLENPFTSNDCTLIWPGITTGDIFSEFYLVQNRQAVGNDYDLWFTPDGLAIWHVDATLNAEGTNFAFNNSNTAHKLVRLMEADGLEEIETRPCPSGNVCRFANAGDMYNAGDHIGPLTTPSSDRYDGTDSCVRVWDVADLGPIPGAEISASFSTICNQPPICNADGPYTAECQGTSTSHVLDGTASHDPDGDAFTYLWTSACPGGSFNDPTSSMPMLTVDTSFGCSLACNVGLTVTDTVGDPAVCSSSLSINDTLPPQLVCPADKTIECDDSTDPSHTGNATASDVCSPTVTIAFTDVTNPGACPSSSVISRTWTSADNCGNSSSCVQTIHSVDTTPPVIHSVAATPNILWPANHKLVQVEVTATATDNCDPAPHCTITSVNSNEPVNGLGDGDTTPDWVITGDLTVDLRAERSGSGNGRIYTLTVTCADSCANSSVGTTTVTVPRDRRK